jgi:hypothetical protein
MTSVPGLSCTVLQLPYVKPAAKRGRHHRSVHAISGYPASAAYGSKHWTPLPRHEARTTPLRPEASGGAAVCLDAGFRPWQKQSAERIRQVRACGSASRPEPTGGEDSCLRRQPSKDAAVLPTQKTESPKERLRTACVRSLVRFLGSCFPTRNCVLSALSRPQGLSACLPEPSRYR